ncbi:hypothetical protein EsH8_X_000388 [Colletotrichum jinshuiense]
MDFFVRHLADPTAIDQEPSLSNVVERVRETAVCLAVLGQVDYGTQLLGILHSHGVPPFDLREFGPEVRSDEFAQCRSLAKGGTDYAVPVSPPRPDPFTRIVFAFAWEHTGTWPSWATPAPEPVSSNFNTAGGRAEQDNEADLDALERYARILVCNRFGPVWREDEETYKLVCDLARGQINRANPHGPIPLRLCGFWALWERMLAPWPMNQVVKATGRVLALDLAVRLAGRDTEDDSEEDGKVGEGSEKEVIDEFLADDIEEENGDDDDVEAWGRSIANLHTAQDQMPMLGSMRALWNCGWFTDPDKNALVKFLGLDVAEIRRVANTGCDMLAKRLKYGPTRPYEGYTVSELVREIDKNTRTNAPYVSDEEAQDRQAWLTETTVDGTMQRDEDKVFRPATLLRHPTPSHQEITELEGRLEVSAPLPDQYKSFLRTTNGMAPIWWNESQLLRLLAPISKVEVDDDELPPSLSIELLSGRGLDGSNSIDWPLIPRAICVSEGGHDGHVWLIEPKYVKQAKDAFFQVYESRPEDGKRLLRREVEEVYGSIEAFRELEWAVLLWTAWFADTTPYRDFGALLEGLAVGSQRKLHLWSLNFEPNTRKLSPYFYLPSDEWNSYTDGRNVENGKGNVIVPGDGTMCMGDNIYPDNAITKPKVDR